MQSMVYLRNNIQTFDHHEFIESFLQNRKTDCILYSREGTKYDVHKEILFPTILMKNILSTDSNIGCCQNLEIFCPCPANELESMLKLLYGGSIFYNSEKEASYIVGNLNKIFGFHENLFSVEHHSDVEVKEEEHDIEEISQEKVPAMERIQSTKSRSDIMQNPLKCSLNDNNANVIPKMSKPLKRDVNGNESYLKDNRDKICINKKSMKMEHIKSVHKGKNNFQCKVCYRKFSSPNDLMRHISSVHEGKNNFQCKICYKKFSSPNNLIRHSSIAHTHPCNSCEKKFIKEDQLRKHILLTHASQDQKEKESFSMQKF